MVKGSILQLMGNLAGIGVRCFANKELALEWYDKLTVELYQGVPKVVSGVEENVEVISEYQMV